MGMCSNKMNAAIDAIFDGNNKKLTLRSHMRVDTLKFIKLFMVTINSH